ncbi:ODAD1 central coiled coil region domain-containing protein [Plasmodiophora brassicae]
MDVVVRDLTQRLRRPNGTVRKAQGLERVRQKQLAKMTAANDEMCQQVGLAMAEALAPPTTAAAQSIAMSQDLPVKIANERDRLANVESQIRSWQSQLLEVRIREGSDVVRNEQVRKDQRIVRMLENRIQSSLLKHNVIHAQNVQLKQEQAAFRRDRAIADSILAGLEANLRTVMVKICKQAAECDAAQEMHGKSEDELRALQTSSETWYRTFNVDWAGMTAQFAEHNRKQSTGPERRSSAPVITTKEERMYARRHTKAEWRAMTDRANVAVVQGKLDELSRTAAQLTQATLITDLDAVIASLAEKEKDTFALFNVLNELVQERQQLEATQSETTEEQQQAQANVAGVTQREQALVDKIRAAEAGSQSLQVVEDQTRVELRAVLERIRTLFRSLGASRPVPNLKTALIDLEEFVFATVQAYRDANGHVTDDPETKDDACVDLAIALPSPHDESGDPDDPVARRMSRKSTVKSDQ